MSGGEDMLPVDEGAAAELAAVVHEGGDPGPLSLIRGVAISYSELKSLEGSRIFFFFFFFFKLWREKNSPTNMLEERPFCGVSKHNHVCGYPAGLLSGLFRDPDG